jgi:hypothetical protein
MYKDDDWCDFVHTTSASKARILFLREYGGLGEFIDVRAKREPLLDDIPLTGKNIVAAGYNSEWASGHSYACKCIVCKNGGVR